MQNPVGAIAVAEVAIYDADTRRRWTRTRTARLWIDDYSETHDGEWPSIKQIMRYADVGQGTAHRALVAAREARG